MKGISLMIACIVAFFTFSTVTHAKKDFQDISGKTGSHYEAIHYLNGLHVYDYKTTPTFQLNKPVSRGEISKLLHNLLAEQLPKKRTYTNQLKDIQQSPFASEIMWAYEVGILDGDEKGNFKPNQSVKRAHLAKILVQSFGLETGQTFDFSDVPKTSWYYEFVNILASHNITKGNEKNQFLPNDNVTSAQLATFLYRALQLNTSAVMQSTANQLEITQQQASVATSMEPAVLNSEYDFKWHVLGQNAKLELAGILDGKTVAGYLTVSGKSFSGASSLQIGKQKMSDVKQVLGTPEKAIKKGNTNYVLNETNEYMIYLLDDYYVTYFFDVHKGHVIRSILYIDREQELKKEGFSGATVKIKQALFGSEQLMVELMNQARAAEGMVPLRYAKEWTMIARDHSTEMATSNFFDHRNGAGEEPFDRMKRGGMDIESFSTWGENISYGQFNAIYAHEGLMNSYGHRVNILNGDFRESIVGIDINSKNQPFYTVKFYTVR